MSFYSKLYFSPCLFSTHQVFCSFFWLSNHFESHKIRIKSMVANQFIYVFLVGFCFNIYTFNVTCLFFMIWIVFLRTLLFPFFSINFYAGIRLFWNFWCCFSICDFSFLFFFSGSPHIQMCIVNYPLPKIYGIGLDLVFFSWKRQKNKKKLQIL